MAHGNRSRHPWNDQAIRATHEIAERCEFAFEIGHLRFPRFTPTDATLAWRQWQAEVLLDHPGPASLMARATDGAGAAQPLETRPNTGGYGNNSIHQVGIDVRS